MFEQLDSIKKRFEEVEKLLIDPKTIADRKQYIQLNKEHGVLSKVIAVHSSYSQIVDEIKGVKDLLQKESDPDFVKMAKDELEMLLSQKQILHNQLQNLLIPKDPNDDKNSILEIRAGTGGGEAAIWAGDLFRMYQRFAENKKWKLQILDYTESMAGGYKEIICTIHGEGVYGTLKHESGIHRVQRVPTTEAQGRIHTSAASIVLLPEVDEVSITIDMNEIRKDTFCSSGPGGQSVNTTYSAVRLTHLPTNTVATCQDEKSQLKNYEKALSVLRARLHEQAMQKQQAKLGATRKSMVGSGDRSEKIRTYNYPQDRVTDHRINYTAHNLTAILSGSIDNLIEALHTAHNEKVSQQEK